MIVCPAVPPVVKVTIICCATLSKERSAGGPFTILVMVPPHIVMIAPPGPRFPKLVMGWGGTGEFKFVGTGMGKVLVGAASL